jgi:DNA modification methylase
MKLIGRFMTVLQTSLEPLHRFHPYCARFSSEIVEDALQRYAKPGDSVFDPFCGSGTTLVAGLAHRCRVVGTDIDTVAGTIALKKLAARATGLRMTSSSSAHMNPDLALSQRGRIQQSDVTRRWS